MKKNTGLKNTFKKREFKFQIKVKHLIYYAFLCVSVVFMHGASKKPQLLPQN